MLGPYSEQLAELGAGVTAARKAFIEKAATAFNEAFLKVSLGLEGVLKYRPDLEGDKKSMLEALEKSLEKDQQRGYTARGPHADNLEIKVNSLKARRFASQGQQRIAVLALKIAETATLQEVTGRIPIMLLDDISSELDRDRNRELFGYLRSVGGQVFITTTHLDHVLIENDRAEYTIENGTLNYESK
jgi:DNA replication and repair protein RecF